MEQKFIINCPYYEVNSANQVEKFILEKLKEKQGGYSVAINAIKIVKYNKDPQTKEVIDNALIQTPDGFGAQMSFRQLYHQKVMKLDLPGLDTVLNFK